jgi:acyl-CoA thioester hydrolase
VFTVTVTPRSYELDSLGHINNAVIAAWFEVGRVGFIESLTAGEGKFNAGGGWVLASVTIDYRDETFYGDDVEIQCFPARIGNSSLHLQCRMLQAGRLTVEGAAVMVHRSPDGGGSTRIPEGLRRRLDAHLVNDSGPGSR